MDHYPVEFIFKFGIELYGILLNPFNANVDFAF